MGKEKLLEKAKNVLDAALEVVIAITSGKKSDDISRSIESLVSSVKALQLIKMSTDIEKGYAVMFDLDCSASYRSHLMLPAKFFNENGRLIAAQETLVNYINDHLNDADIDTMLEFDEDEEVPLAYCLFFYKDGKKIGYMDSSSGNNEYEERL